MAVCVIVLHTAANMVRVVTKAAHLETRAKALESCHLFNFHIWHVACNTFQINNGHPRNRLFKYFHYYCYCDYDER